MEPSEPGWESTVGMFAGDEVMKRIAEAGRQWREAERRKARAKNSRRTKREGRMSKSQAESRAALSNQDRRLRKAASLLRKWLAEQDDYDERVWPALEPELNDGGMRGGDTDEPPA